MSKTDAFAEAGRQAVLQNIQGTLESCRNSRPSIRWMSPTSATW